MAILPATGSHRPHPRRRISPARLSPKRRTPWLTVLDDRLLDDDPRILRGCVGVVAEVDGDALHDLPRSRHQHVALTRSTLGGGHLRDAEVEVDPVPAGDLGNRARGVVRDVP